MGSSAEILRELSDSRYTVYDVLPAFFSHTDPVVTMAILTGPVVETHISMSVHYGILPIPKHKLAAVHFLAIAL
ncbi:hypothetical protein P692DRAFT_20881684 [Suillus brevipes Sb2]|nr:hypothetical protein P692DRAFT_20881684 [Suillus brevipes Sb2]